MIILKNKRDGIPKKPGIYLWLDNKNKILYAGRATNLKNRINQYFSSNIDPRIREMTEKSIKIKIIETGSLLEAVILEAKYIKKYWPKYNIKDRDDRSFIYIILPKKDFSFPIITRGRDLSRYSSIDNNVFGPYQSLSIVKNALKIIRRIFPYSTCNINSGRACFDYQIGLCPGSCLGLIDKKEYNKNIKNIILLFEGKKELLLKKLAKENPEQERSLKHLQDVSLLQVDRNLKYIGFNRIEAYDISHLSGQEAYGSMVVFNSYGEPEKDKYRIFKIKNKFKNDDLRALQEILERRFDHLEWPMPDLILIDGGLPQINFLYPLFKQYKFNNAVGLSKFSGDELVFLKSVNKDFKNNILNIKSILLQARDEAHRFANRARIKSKKYERII